MTAAKRLCSTLLIGGAMLAARLMMRTVRQVILRARLTRWHKVLGQLQQRATMLRQLGADAAASQDRNATRQCRLAEARALKAVEQVRGALDDGLLELHHTLQGSASSGAARSASSMGALRQVVIELDATHELLTCRLTGRASGSGLGSRRHVPLGREAMLRAERRALSAVCPCRRLTPPASLAALLAHRQGATAASAITAQPQALQPRALLAATRRLRRLESALDFQAQGKGWSKVV